MATYKLSVKPFDMLEVGVLQLFVTPSRWIKRLLLTSCYKHRDNFWHLRQSHILKFHSKQTLPAD